MNIKNLLKKLIAIPSVYSKERELAEFISNYLLRVGFTIEKVSSGSKRFNLIATYGKRNRYLGFYGHMDTVQPHPNYRHDPYELLVKQNKALGLGVADMKGGIAAILKAGEFAVKNHRPVKLIFGVDEENISQGAHDLVDSQKLENIDFLIVGESGQITDYRQPFSVCIGRRGRILFEAIVRGKTAQAAESHLGVNAIEKAADVVRILTSMHFPTHRSLGKTTVVIHTIESEANGFSVPDSCRITFSLLSNPRTKSKGFQEKFLALAKREKIDCTIQPVARSTPYGESYEINQNSPFFKTLRKDIFDRYGVKPIHTVSVADENVFANLLGIPVLSIGPIGGGDHTPEEWLDLRSLETVESVYKQIIALYYKMGPN